MSGGEEDPNAAGPRQEKDTGAQVAAIVRLEEVAVTTGEDHEDAVLDMQLLFYSYAFRIVLIGSILVLISLASGMQLISQVEN